MIVLRGRPAQYRPWVQFPVLEEADEGGEVGRGGRKKGTTQSVALPDHRLAASADRLPSALHGHLVQPARPDPSLQISTLGLYFLLPLPGRGSPDFLLPIICTVAWPAQRPEHAIRTSSYQASSDPSLPHAVLSLLLTSAPCIPSHSR